MVQYRYSLCVGLESDAILFIYSNFVTILLLIERAAHAKLAGGGVQAGFHAVLHPQLCHGLIHVIISILAHRIDLGGRLFFLPFLLAFFNHIVEL